MRNQGLLVAPVVVPLVALVIGVAAPVPPALAEDRETTGRIRYKDDAPPDHAAEPADAARGDGWVELADPSPTKHGKVFITVGASAGTFSKLRIDARTGRPRVKTVRVDFKYGPSRIVEVRTRLDPKRKRSVYVDLHGAHEIRQIVVEGDPRSAGTYTVHGDTSPPPERATVTVTR
jgi:hypothetical protein